MEAPWALAVTVLTSDAGAPAHILGDRVRTAAAAGCGGVVCATSDVAEAKGIAPGLLAVVPGIRPGGTDRNDQARSATPEAALAAGADLLVIGRAVTAAADRREAAASSSTRFPERWGRRIGRFRRPPLGRLALGSLLMPLPPALTPDQRQAALEKAAVARRVRAELKEKLKMGSLTLAELLEQGDTDEIVGKMKVLSVLGVPPGPRQGQGPPAHGGGRHHREPPGAGPGRPAAQEAVREAGLSLPDRRSHVRRCAAGDLRRVGARRGGQGHGRPAAGRHRRAAVAVPLVDHPPAPPGEGADDYVFVDRDAFHGAGRCRRLRRVDDVPRQRPPLRDPHPGPAAGSRRAARDRARRGPPDPGAATPRP